MRFLLIEDDPDQRKVFTLLLKELGHEVYESSSAAEARTVTGYEIALVDRNLPDADGVDLACALEAKAYLLTGEDLPRVIQKRLDEAGVAVLKKPMRAVDFARLFA